MIFKCRMCCKLLQITTDDLVRLIFLLKFFLLDTVQIHSNKTCTVFSPREWVIDSEIGGVIYNIHAQASSQSLITSQTVSTAAKGES